jgi:hypothetical protein
MSQSYPIQVRLPSELFVELKEVASSTNQTLPAVIRERLALASFFHQTVLSLRTDLALLGALPSARGLAGHQPLHPAVLEGMLAEILMTLRILASPQKMKEAQASVEYGGLPVWKPR